MNDNIQLNSESDFGQGTTKTYALGFGLSLLLTLAAYLLVWRHVHTHHRWLSDVFLIFLVIALAQIQLIVQLRFFLHLGRGSKQRWNLTVLAFAAMVVLILVLGSLWIMNNLNYHHDGYGTTHDGNNLTSPSQTNQYIIHDEGIHQ
ncbi:MAG TPA: cytochrome o ubiquinol oxidase subunit IV [Candidatus Saccharimonadales bacterium]|nr:cytochrome o ubiquinol oxidase subunit IV [Candidatus Saccharimonadales bacterium]